MRHLRAITIATITAIGMMAVLDQTTVAADAKADAKAAAKAEKRALKLKALEEAKKAAAAAPPVKSAESAPVAPETPAVTKTALPQDAVALAKRIDALISQKLAAEKIVASPRC